MGDLLLRSLAPRDVVELPEVAVEVGPHRDGNEIHGDHAAVLEGEFDPVADHAFLKNVLQPAALLLRIVDPLQAHREEFHGAAVHQHVRGNRDLEHCAEGLVDQRDLAILGLHEDTGLHVLDEGAQARGDGGQHRFGTLALRDVVQGARDADDDTFGARGDPVVQLHPTVPALLGAEPELAPDRVLARFHGIGERVQVAALVVWVHVAQEWLPQTFVHVESRNHRPGGVKERPFALPVDLEHHFLEVGHQGLVPR